MARSIAFGSRRYGVPSGVFVQVGDIVTYTTFMGGERRVLVDNVDDTGHPGGPEFDGVLLQPDSDEPMWPEGDPYARVWGRSSQVHTIEQPS